MAAARPPGGIAARPRLTGMAAAPALAPRRLRDRLRPGPATKRSAGIALRLLAGFGGGYGVAALLTVLLAATLPMPRVEAVLTASMASFAVLAGAIVWAFAAGSPWRACAGIAVPAALLGLALLLLTGPPA